MAAHSFHVLVEKFCTLIVYEYIQILAAGLEPATIRLYSHDFRLSAPHQL